MSEDAYSDLSDSDDGERINLDDEDRFVVASQCLLVSRRRGPGRQIDTSGSFYDFSKRMFDLRDKRRKENEQKECKQ